MVIPIPLDPNKNWFLLWFCFLVALAVLGIVTLSIFVHEVQHLDPSRFEEEAICFDYTGKSYAYAILNKTAFDQSMMDVDSFVADHYRIYFIQGLVTGLLLICILYAVVVVTNYLIDLEKESKHPITPS